MSADDLAIVRAWLVQHGDRRAAERRRARAEHIEQGITARLVSQGNSGDEIERAVHLLHAAVALLLRLSADLKERGREPWTELRTRYLQAQAAHKVFEDMAREAGVVIVKKRREPGQSTSQVVSVLDDERTETDDWTMQEGNKVG